MPRRFSANAVKLSHWSVTGLPRHVGTSDWAAEIPDVPARSGQHPRHHPTRRTIAPPVKMVVADQIGPGHSGRLNLRLYDLLAGLSVRYDMPEYIDRMEQTSAGDPVLGERLIKWRSNEGRWQNHWRAPEPAFWSYPALPPNGAEILKFEIACP